MARIISATEQFALDRSLQDAFKIARRLSSTPNIKAHRATLALISTLKKLGAKDGDE